MRSASPLNLIEPDVPNQHIVLIEAAMTGVGAWPQSSLLGDCDYLLWVNWVHKQQ